MSNSSRRISPMVFVGILAVLSGAPAPAAPRAGTTPPGSEIGAASALDARTDARLGQVVPIAIYGEPLADALGALSEKTGVKLEASRDVAELKVTVLARELPLERSLTEVARLLDLTWTRRGTAPAFRYECARSLAATQRARGALDEARRTNRATVLAQLTRVVEAMKKGDTTGLSATDPQIGALLNDPARGEQMKGMFQGLASLPPPAMQALVQQGSLTTGYEQMPPASQEMVRRATENVLPLALANVRGPNGNSPGYEDFVKSATYTLGVNGLDYGGNTYYGEMRAGSVSMRFAIDLGSALAPPPAAKEAGGAVAPAVAARTATTTRTRRPLPALPATLDSPKPLSVRAITDWLAEKLPLTVVADYYATRYEQPLVPVSPGARAEAILAALEKYGEIEATLADDDRVLRLRSRRWPLDDLMEPPAAVVESLERALKENGGRLGLSEYLYAAPLSDGQGAGLARIDATKYGALGRVLDGSRPLLKEGLRLVATLNPAQRAAAASPEGLTIAQLTPAQRGLVVASVTRQKADVRPAEVAAASLKFRREDRAAQGGIIGAPPMETYVFLVTLPSRGDGDAKPTTLSASLVLGPVTPK